MAQMSIKKVLAKLLTQSAQPCVQVKRISFGPYTVNANTALAINTYDACIQACPSGYSYVGIVGFSSNQGNTMVYSARPENNQWAFEAKNYGTGQASVSPHIYALYARNI